MNTFINYDLRLSLCFVGPDGSEGAVILEALRDELKVAFATVASRHNLCMAKPNIKLESRGPTPEDVDT